MTRNGKIGAAAHGISKEFRFNVIIPVHEAPDRDFTGRTLETAINWREKFVREDITLRVGEPRPIEANLMTVNCIGNDGTLFTLELERPKETDAHEYAALVVGSCFVDLRRIDVYEKFTCAGCDEVFGMSEAAAQCDVCGVLFCKNCAGGKPWREHLEEHES